MSSAGKSRPSNTAVISSQFDPERTIGTPGNSQSKPDHRQIIATNILAVIPFEHCHDTIWLIGNAHAKVHFFR